MNLSLNKVMTQAGFLVLVSIPMTVYGYLDDEEDLINAFGDEEIISLATGRSQPISPAPAVATVITARDIEEMGATNLDQVLDTLPGIHFSISSFRFSPIISIHWATQPTVLAIANITVNMLAGMPAPVSWLKSAE